MHARAIRPKPTAIEVPADLVAQLETTAYRALSVIGKGGQGLVLDAEHRHLGKRVVLKVLHGRLAADAVLIERMRIEAQALARLRSPHIVEVHDFGQLGDGRTFFVMDKLEGETVKSRVKSGGPLPPHRAVEIARQLLSALAVLHGAGLVHRDVKPDNIFLHRCDGKETVKLLDLGVAKVLPGQGAAVVNAALPTVQGATIGTPRFLAPEQAYGGAVDGRSDVYSVGATLYWMLTGRDPFAHHTQMLDLLKAHVAEEPPPVSAFANVPRTLERVIARSLAKHKDDRFASAEAFSSALGEALTDDDESHVRTARVAAKGPAAGPLGTIRIQLPSSTAVIPRSPPNNPFRLPANVVPSITMLVMVVLAAASLTAGALLGARLLGLSF
ncbi:MAG: serine/threonine protein kinase [Polyangiaceae bacterium]|nr:serine/threonine protein kinase [Polyangiaceae bacterium]